MTQQLCVVSGCGLSGGDFGTFLFNVPSDVAERESWRTALGASNLTDSDLVCWSHFEIDSLRREGGSFQLEPSAIPVQFLETTETLIEGTPDQFCRLCAKRVGAEGGNDLARMYTSEDSSLLLNFLLADLEDSLSRKSCDECLVQVKCSLRLIRNCKKASKELDRINLRRVKATEEILLKPEVKEELDDYGEYPADPVEADIKSEDSSLDSSTEAEDDFECPKCSYTCTTQQQLEKHMRKHQKVPKDGKKLPKADYYTATGQFQCPECPSVFERRIQLASHLKKHNGKVPKVKSSKGPDEFYECEFCDFKCKLRQQLAGHRSTHSEEIRKTKPPEKIYDSVCPICGKVLATRGSYATHMKIHYNQRDFPCEVCGKKFFKKKQRDSHVESVHEKKTWECKICGVKCKWENSLERHMLKHEANSYKYSCTQCDKKFLTPYLLKTHMTKHTGHQVFCEICGAGFRFNFLLTQHKIREHDIQVEGVKLYKRFQKGFRKGATKRKEQPNYSPANAPDDEQCELASSLTSHHSEQHMAGHDMAMSFQQLSSSADGSGQQVSNY